MPTFSVRTAFVECQHTAASHPKLVKQLIKLYLKQDFEQFVTQFVELLKDPLVHGDKQSTVERTLNFITKFATSVKSDLSEEERSKNAKNASMNEDNDDDEAEVDPFLVRLFQFLLNNHEANSKAVRFRVCQLINKLLNGMGEHASIDDELYSTIYDTMLQRLLDKVPTVRLQAILALARLQDPRNKECPVIKAYRFHLSMDPNPEVRRAVLNNIAITFQTLPDIIERTRDVRDLVRRQTYLVLSQKVHIRSLTIEQRVRLISEGLNDRSEMVRNSVEKMLIPAWLRLVDGKVLDLLTCLDVEASTEGAILALNTHFRNVPYNVLLENFNILNENKVIDITELRPEYALYWKVLVEYLRTENAENALDSVLPDLLYFCRYLEEFALGEIPDGDDQQEMAVRLMEKEFVLQQLISMTMLFDLGDEFGRRALDQAVRALLMSDKVGELCIKGLVAVFAKLHPPTSRINQLAEMISDIREPVTAPPVQPITTPMQVEKHPMSDADERKKKLKLASLKVKLNTLREELEDCVRTLDLEKAQELKEKLRITEDQHNELVHHVPQTPVADAPATDITPAVTPDENEEERSDPVTLSRCLTIISQALVSLEITVVTPTLHSLHDNLLLPCLRSQNPRVRNHAVHALWLLCLVSKDYAKQHLLLFVQISQIDIEEIQMTALKAVFDFLLLYGVEEFSVAAEDITNTPGFEVTEEDKDEENPTNTIITALSEILDSESSEVRTQVAEGLCKLLLASRISSPKLLLHLTLKWYNPTSDDDQKLRHMLGVFFPLYASHGGTNQESLSTVVIPMLHTLFNAPQRSPLADVDIDDVANFLISITSPAIVSDKAKEKVNVHDTLVFTLCTEILTYEGGFTKNLVRCLNLLSLTSTNFTTLRQIEVLADKMLKKVKERVCQNGLEKFQATVKNFLKDAPKLETDAPNVDEQITIEVKEPDTVNTPGVEDTTMNNTIARRKRMLYNTINAENEMFSSDWDSDLDTVTPMKKCNLSPDVFTESELTNTVVQNTEFSTEDEDEKTPIKRKRGRPAKGSKINRLSVPVDGELELTQGNVSNSNCEVFQSPLNNSVSISVSTERIDKCSEEESSSANESVSEIEELPSKVVRRGRRKQIIDSSSTEKSTSPNLSQASKPEKSSKTPPRSSRRKVEKVTPESSCSTSTSDEELSRTPAKIPRKSRSASSNKIIMESLSPGKNAKSSKSVNTTSTTVNKKTRSTGNVRRAAALGSSATTHVSDTTTTTASPMSSTSTRTRSSRTSASTISSHSPPSSLVPPLSKKMKNSDNSPVVGTVKVGRSNTKHIMSVSSEGSDSVLSSPVSNTQQSTSSPESSGTIIDSSHNESIRRTSRRSAKDTDYTIETKESNRTMPIQDKKHGSRNSNISSQDSSSPSVTSAPRRSNRSTQANRDDKK